MLKRILNRAQLILTAASLILIALLLRNQWSQLQSQSWRLQWHWLLVAALCMLASWVMEVSLWRQVLGVLRHRLPFVVAWRIWFLSAVVRYLPGNVWQALSMTLYCQRWGIRPEETITSVALYQIITMLAVAPIAAIYFPLSNNWGLLTDLLAGQTLWLVTLGLLPLLAVLMWPDWLTAAINWLLRKAARPELAMQLTTARLLRLLAVAVLTWLCWGATFAALTVGLRAYTLAEVIRLTPHLVAVYAVGYAIGLLSFLTPSGLGVREGAFYILLVPLLNGGTVTVAALAMRIWTMAGELLMAGLCLVGRRRVLAPIPAAATAPEYAVPYAATSEAQAE